MATKTLNYTSEIFTVSRTTGEVPYNCVLETRNAEVAENIPSYSKITNVTYKTFVKETTNFFLGNADFSVYFADSNRSRIGEYLYNKGSVVPKNNKEYLTVSLDMTPYVLSSVENAGYFSYSNAAYIRNVINSTAGREYAFYFSVDWTYTLPTYKISLSTSGGGTVSGAGTYDVGSTATIKATPNAGYYFAGWSDGNQNAVRNITVEESDISANETQLTYTAIFSKTDLDLNYDNMFSFSAFAASPAQNGEGAGSGTVAMDVANGVVTVSGSGDFYTAMAPVYNVPVTRGQQYVFRYDVTANGSNQVANLVQAFVFFVDDAGNFVTDASTGLFFVHSYIGEHLYFSPPQGCTRVSFRVGVSSNNITAVFSNIALCKASIYAYEITNRQYRKNFTAGSPLGVLYEPERLGYSFQGWYTGENGTGQQIRRIDTISANTTVYSHWVKRTYCDVNYDNLFSFSDWAYSPSGRPQGLSDSAYIGTVSTDIANGTVTVTGADPNGSAFYTNYGAFSPYHRIPVQAGQQYAFRYTVNQTYNMQAFVFFCNDNEEFVTDPSTGLQFVFDTNGNDLIFTPPSGCTKVCFRLGVGGINTAVFSNIGLYKTSLEYGITNRQIRKIFPVGSAVGTLYTPLREHHDFTGWYTDEDGTGSQVTSSNAFSKSLTVYSAWRLNKIYVGVSRAKEIYVGTQKVKAIYVGTTKVYG